MTSDLDDVATLEQSDRQVRARLARVENERDALLKALEQIEAWPREYEVCGIARAALCKVEREQLGSILDTQRDKFEAAVRPVMEYLAKNHHPHTSIHIDSTVAELVEGCMVLNTSEYVVD